jgi:hypothetical protein
LFSREEAARAQQVRAEIGRLLREHYDVSSAPMSDHLTDVVKKMEQSDTLVRPMPAPASKIF